MLLQINIGKSLFFVSVQINLLSFILQYCQIKNVGRQQMIPVLDFIMHTKVFVQILQRLQKIFVLLLIFLKEDFGLSFEYDSLVILISIYILRNTDNEIYCALYCLLTLLVESDTDLCPVLLLGKHSFHPAQNQNCPTQNHFCPQQKITSVAKKFILAHEKVGERLYIYKQIFYPGQF